MTDDHRPGQRRPVVHGHARSLLDRPGPATRPRGSAWSRCTRRSCCTGAAAGGLREDDAADVFQEVFQSVAAHLSAFRRDRSGDTFRGWLRTITRNKVNDSSAAATGAGRGRRERGRAHPRAGAARAPAEEDQRGRRRGGGAAPGPGADPRGVRAADVGGVLANGGRGAGGSGRRGGPGDDPRGGAGGEVARVAPPARPTWATCSVDDRPAML